MPNSRFDQRVRGLRRKYGLTQAQLATILGVTANTVARLERGESRPSGTLRRLIWILGRYSDMAAAECAAQLR